MPTSFRIDYEDEATARAAVARMSTMSGAEMLSVTRDGTSVDFAMASPLADGLVKVVAVVSDALQSMAGELAGLFQRRAASD